MENKGSIQKLPLDIDFEEVSYKIRNMKFNEDKEKLFFLIFKLFNLLQMNISLDYINETCSDISSYEMDFYMDELKNMGVYTTNIEHITLKPWDRRSHKIVPRNFMKKLIEITTDFEKKQNEYDSIHFGFFQKLKTSMRKYF